MTPSDINGQSHSQISLPCLENLPNCKIAFYIVSCGKMTHVTPGNYHMFPINYGAKQLLPWVVSVGFRFFFFFLSSPQPSKNDKERYFHTMAKIYNMKVKQTPNYYFFKIFLVVKKLAFYLT